MSEEPTTPGPVSQERVALVRRLFEVLNRQEADAVGDLWTADAEWRPAYLAGGLVEGTVFRGPDGMAQFINLQAETWSSVVADPVEIRGFGDSVLVKVHLSAIGRASGIPVERATWNLFEVSNGRIAGGRAYLTEQEALKAAGLEE